MAQSKKPAPKKKDYNPYGKAKKGESKQARAKRQKSYYSYQREHAEETGDQSTVDRIYAKLGQSSHNVNANQTDQMALGAVPAMAGLPGLIRAIAPMLGALAARGGPAAQQAGQRVPALARPMQRPGMPQQPALPAPQRALPAPQRALPSPQRALPSQAGRSVSRSPLNRESGASTKFPKGFKADKPASKKASVPRKASSPKRAPAKKVPAKAKGK